MFMRGLKDMTKAFHSDVVANIRSADANPVGLQMLDQQIRMHVATLQVNPSFIQDRVTDTQRDACRGFTPAIAAAMQAAYVSCVGEEGKSTKPANLLGATLLRHLNKTSTYVPFFDISTVLLTNISTTGKGTYARMKRIIESHVATARHTMFREACDAVIGQLDAMCASIEQDMSAFVRKFLSTLERDYMTTLIGESPQGLATVPLVERVLRRELRPILEGADSRFAGLRLSASGARYLP